MNEVWKSRRTRRKLDRRGLGLTSAALIMVAVVVAVGAVAYVVLNMESTTTTKTVSQHGCAPASSPACAGNAGSVVVSPHVSDPRA